MRTIVLLLTVSSLAGGVALLAPSSAGAHHLGNAPTWIGVNEDRVHAGQGTDFYPANRPTLNPRGAPTNRPDANQVNRPGDASGSPTRTRPATSGGQFGGKR